MLTLSRLSCRVMGRLLFEDGSLSVSDGWRVGVVGLNGTGKSTLFRIIAGETEADGGTVSITAQHRVGMVRQDLPDCDTPLLDLVLAADTERTRLLAECDNAEDPNRLAEVYARLEEIGAQSAPARAASILSGLGFSDEQMAEPFSALSGGWRMRVALASALFLQPELLLLDEPTNHLDLEAIIWLEGYLATYPHTLLVISHDRNLLNACCDHIIHLHDRKLVLYTGNYDTFERERAAKLDLQQKRHDKLQAQRAHIQAFIDRFRSKATKARQAQSRIKMLEKMDQVDAVMAERAIRFSFPQPEKLSPPLLAINKASVGYVPGRPVLRQVDERIDMDDRIALLGANGNGKSTLIKLLAGKLEATGGDIHRAGKLRIGYFSQHQGDELDPEATPYLLMLRLFEKNGVDSSETAVRARLGQFGFPKDLADSTISTLSGGEKARLLFALISFHAPHLLLLDEPTNHLDMDARAALADALNSYDGAVVIVSHDPSLLEHVADRLWLVHDGKVQDFDGDMADYRRFVLEQKRAARRSDKTKRPDERAGQRKSSAEQRRALAPLAKAASTAEKEVERLTAEKLRLEQLMGDGAFYDDAAAAQKTQKTYGLLLKQLEEAELRWLEAAEAHEQAKTAGAG